MSFHESHTLVDLLRLRAEVQADDRGYTFLVNGETEGDTLTYGQLDQRSRQIAVLLRRSLSCGDRVLLMYRPGLEFITAFFGCLYAGVIAVPAYPPHPAKPTRDLPRLRSIAREAGVSAILCTENDSIKLSTLFGDAPELARVPLLSTDHNGLEDANSWQQPRLEPNTIAFLQYTSGSTAAPKGVMVSHGNMLHNLACIQHHARVDGRAVGVSWLPTFHDMGMFAGFLFPLFEGFPSYLMSPVAFLQKPIRWLQAISRYRGTTSGGPNFAYDLCVQRVNPEQCQGLDLSCWQIAYNGAEPIRNTTLKRFWMTFRESRFRWNAFRTVYGLAEATVFVCSGRTSNEPDSQAVEPAVPADAGDVSCGQPVLRERGKNGSLPRSGAAEPFNGLVSCGSPCFGTKVVVVDPHRLVQVRPGEVGEIWISSPSVARGYWDRPDETDRTFRAYLKETKDLEATTAGPFLRTGDLGFMRHGELFVTGRIKDLIIIRGRKHYPHDIEQTVESSHPLIRPHCTAAVAVPTDGGERLMIVAEVDRRRRARGLDQHDLERSSVELDEVMGTIRQAVAEQHELQTHGIWLVAPGEVPKTSSGKIQRHACRTSVLSGTLKSLAQWPLPTQPGSPHTITNQAVA